MTRQTPWQGLFELSYVGNRSRDLQNTQGGAGSNINLVPYGSLLSATNPATANANLYRKYQGYGDLNLATNNLYQNYNAMQVSWARHAGLYVIQANYTFQKALGIANPTVDPFNLARQLRLVACRPQKFIQRGVLVGSRTARSLQFPGKRISERLADHRRHPD